VQAGRLKGPHVRREVLVAADRNHSPGLWRAGWLLLAVDPVEEPGAELESEKEVIATNVRGTWLSMKYEVLAILGTGGGAS